MGLEPMLAVLAHSWDLCGRSWAALGTFVGGLGLSWGQSGRSWKRIGVKLTVLACLGAKAVGLGSGSGRKVAQSRAGKRSGQEIRPKSGPNPSGNAIQEGRAPRSTPRPAQAI